MCLSCSACSSRERSGAYNVTTILFLPTTHATMPFAMYTNSGVRRPAVDLFRVYTGHHVTMQSIDRTPFYFYLAIYQSNLALLAETFPWTCELYRPFLFFFPSFFRRRHRHPPALFSSRAWRRGRFVPAISLSAVTVPCFCCVAATRDVFKKSYSLNDN